MTQPAQRGPIPSLAFWAKNMTVIRDGKMEWPGFSYTDDEWARMNTLRQGVSDAAYIRYTFINAVLFIALAAFVMFAVFLPVATFLFPIPAETSALKFTLLLAAFCFLTIGLGLPVSLRGAAALSSDPAQLATVPPSDKDDVLARKVSWQINRITLIMCGLLVPGVMVFIAYDLHGGPIITALKWFAIGLMGLSTAAGVVQQRKAAGR